MGFDPIGEALQRCPVLVLDGAMGTELERRGHTLGERLWSAQVLAEHPEAIRQIHEDSLRAGADVIVTASYQATFEGFSEAGIPGSEVTRLLQRSVDLARSARDEFWGEGPAERRLRPLVAASVGPFGAYLADGSEFRGDYGRSVAELIQFHERRWRVLQAARPDLLACETIPSILEARALRHLLEGSGTAGWVSFSLRDERHLCDGTALEEAVAELESVSAIVAVGVNCVSPDLVLGALSCLKAATSLPLLVAPNSGERWDADGRRWAGCPRPADFAVEARRWAAAGARLIGGCCRTTPEDVAAIRQALTTG